ncbi:hypothetical protein [Pseudorhodobacter aquimaris]|uniref:hypothetical protein n=1 Tax=Pseudorhodobacter aquimaris TaxID=687412 RepID=UPI00067AEAA1|nr:hypothetical protein [Pseudorhodobacter aquimaris]
MQAKKKMLPRKAERAINDTFEMHDGWLLNFSDATMEHWFEEEFNLDLNQKKYHRIGASKAKRFRESVLLGNPHQVARVLRSLWQYRLEEASFKRSDAAEEGCIQKNLFDFIGELEGDTRVAGTDVIEVFQKCETLAELVDAIRRDLDAGRPSAGLDRLAPEGRGDLIFVRCEGLRFRLGQLIVSAWLSVAKREPISSKSIRGKFLTADHEAPDLIVVETYPPIDVAVGQPGDLRGLGERQVVAQHIKYQAVHVRPLVSPGRLAGREGLRTAHAPPPRIVALGLAEALVDIRMLADGEILVRTADGGVAGRCARVNGVQAAHPLVLLNDRPVVLYPRGYAASGTLVELFVLATRNCTAWHAGQRKGRAIRPLERIGQHSLLGARRSVTKVQIDTRHRRRQSSDHCPRRYLRDARHLFFPFGFQSSVVSKRKLAAMRPTEVFFNI